MERKIKRLPETELAVMQAIWNSPQPVSRPQLDVALAQRGWTVSTVIALLARLETKGFIGHRKQGRGYLYYPLIARQDYLAAETKTLLGALYGGRPSNFVAALHSGGALGREEIAELQQYLAQLQKEEGEN